LLSRKLTILIVFKFQIAKTQGRIQGSNLKVLAPKKGHFTQKGHFFEGLYATPNGEHGRCKATKGENFENLHQFNGRWAISDNKMTPLGLTSGGIFFDGVNREKGTQNFEGLVQDPQDPMDPRLHSNNARLIC